SIDKGPQIQRQFVLLRDRRQIPARTVALLRLEVVDDRLLEIVEGVDEILLPADHATQPEIAKCEIYQDEGDVDERDGRLVEIVVVARDELADLVDEESESDAADERTPEPSAVAEEGEAEEEGDRHQQAAPEHVGDVKSRAAHARIASDSQDEPDRQHGRHSADDEQVQVAAGGEVARKRGVERRL